MEGRKMKKFIAFTLAELMVALAVVGTIVAVVTPAIMKTRPNKNKMMIKKTYYTTENIVNSLINNTYLYADMTDECIKGTAECAYGFDLEDEVEYEGETFSGKTKFQKLFASKLNVSREIESNSQKFATTDGVIWDFSNIQTGWTKGTAPKNNVKTLTIDVNGDEGPNALEETSPDDFDQYRIDIQSNGKMRVNANDTKAAEYVTINTSVTN